MKKVFLFMLLTALTLSASAQTTVDNLFANYKSQARAEYVYIPKTMIKMGRLIDKDTKAYTKNIDTIKVLDLEDTSADVKRRFQADARKLQTNGYDELIQATEDGAKVLILTKGKKDAITELIIVVTGMDDCALIQLKGKIRQRDIEKIVRDQLDD